ncbi:uncharacterized protein LOC141525558 [Cotesia typhae]|uniref:uncharacterized protein LOC141525558 n=1 Tax=Cotesia typhae TaxID=2053667 RepID=UPI003D68E633
MIRKLVYFIFVAAAASRALEEQSTKLSLEIPTLASWNLTILQNGTTELVNLINHDIYLINSSNESAIEKSDEYYFYNHSNLSDPLTINTTESLIRINQLNDPNEGFMPSVEGIDQFNGTNIEIEIVKLIKSMNDNEFSNYENQIWLQTINELKKINEEFNKYNVPLVRTKRDPDVNGIVLGTTNRTVLRTVEGMVSGKINGNFFGSNNETVLGTLNGTVLEAADGTFLRTFNGVVSRTINREALESSSRIVLSTVHGMVLGTDNRIVLGTVIGLNKGPIMQKPKRPVSWDLETDNDGTDEEALDENINLIRESVFKRLGSHFEEKEVQRHHRTVQGILATTS